MTRRGEEHTLLAIHPVVREQLVMEDSDEDFYRSILRGVQEVIESADITEDAMRAQRDIVAAGLQVIALLLSKNAAYGNSALDPVSVFSRGLSPAQKIAVRMDDKLSRIARGSAAGEDAALDLAGYLILNMITTLRQPQKEPPRV